MFVLVEGGPDTLHKEVWCVRELEGKLQNHQGHNLTKDDLVGKARHGSRRREALKKGKVDLWKPRSDLEYSLSPGQGLHYFNRAGAMLPIWSERLATGPYKKNFPVLKSEFVILSLVNWAILVHPHPPTPMYG